MSGRAAVFMIGGFENIASTQSWVMIYLAEHQDILAKVRAELKSVVGDRTPTADDISSLRE